jgi:hypothetical protein
MVVCETRGSGCAERHVAYTTANQTRSDRTRTTPPVGKSRCFGRVRCARRSEDGSRWNDDGIKKFGALSYFRQTGRFVSVLEKRYLSNRKKSYGHFSQDRASPISFLRILDQSARIKLGSSWTSTDGCR